MTNCFPKWIPIYTSTNCVWKLKVLYEVTIFAIVGFFWWVCNGIFWFRISLITSEFLRERRQFCYWRSIKQECDVHHRHSTKRLQRQEEISPFYIAKWIQPITFIFAIFNCSFFQIFMTEGRIYNLESGDSWQISKCPPGNNTGPVEVHT